MGVDYYDELQLTRSAADEDIKRSYRRLSLKYHPDADKSPEATLCFQRVAEAYDVLIQPELRALYDQYGETGLKEGVTDHEGGMKGGVYRSTPEPVKIFNTFFGTNNPFSALDHMAVSFQQLSAQPRKKPGKATSATVSLTLEDIFRGVNKRITHTKKILTPGGELVDTEVTLTVNVAPGAVDGAKYVFERAGDESMSAEPGAVVYELVSLPHALFARQGSDLIHHATVPLVKALTGTALELPALDGRLLRIPVTEIVTPGLAKMVTGEGMPKGDGTRGDLHIVFDILFPVALNERQRLLVKAGFYFPQAPTKEQTASVDVFGKAFGDKQHGWSHGGMPSATA